MSEVESAFREGYRAGYESGQSDCAAFESGRVNLSKITEDESWSGSYSAKAAREKLSPEGEQWK